ncbi:MAG: pyridoxamine 5'-phosphate oxidase family protein [Lentisphaeria bacterium]|nr:pyridoxamine 5'-phosphate oxidase family protein [Lentisphaeria bacterium]
MRRSERSMADRAEIDAAIRACPVCRLGLHDGTEPYIVPMSFGYDGECFYFHSAREGRKLEILRRQPRVAIELDELVRVVTAETACGWSMRYRSVTGAGAVEFIEEPAAKRAALAVLMEQYGDRNPEFTDAAVERVCVFRVRPEWLAGKRSL